MDEIVYAVDNRATFNCPSCDRKQTVNVQEYIRRKDRVEIETTCACGHTWTTNIERRRHYRKPVNFRGRYEFSNEVQLDEGISAGKFVGRGKMKVVDLSVSGLKIKLKKSPDLHVNDRFGVEFRLNDKRRTLVRERASVKNIDKNHIGGAFSPSAADNPSLGFFLLG